MTWNLHIIYNIVDIYNRPVFVLLKQFQRKVAICRLLMVTKYLNVTISHNTLIFQLFIIIVNFL